MELHSKLLLTEGNHRLVALEELEVPYFPVCVTTLNAWNRSNQKGYKVEVLKYYITEIGKEKYFSVEVFKNIPYTPIDSIGVDLSFDETDSVTLNVPLLIRLFEFVREDIDNDAQIHKLSENLIQNRGNGVLSMDHYDSLINGVKAAKTIDKIFALGGLAEGASHADGGIPLVVKSTGQKIEIEGGELIMNKFSASETEKFEFEGKELTPCEIVSELNSMDNNGVKIDCNKIVGRFEK
jgi:hypothetical protein